MTTRAVKELADYLEPLTPMQRLYVKARLEGLSKSAAAAAAGANPKNTKQFDHSVAVQEALRKGMEAFSAEVLFSRKKAHEMLMEAHANAANTIEQVAAIKELVRLHGVAAPEVKELRHKHALEDGRPKEVRNLSDEDLLKLAQLPTEQLPHIIDGEYEEVDTDVRGRRGQEEAEAEEAHGS